LDRRSLEASSRAIRTLETKVKEMKASDATRLNSEYQALVSGLQEQGLTTHVPDSIIANPVLPADILEESVPGSIRKAEHFVVFLKRVVEHLKKKIKGTNIEKLTPLSFLYSMNDQSAIERKSLRFTYTRLNSLLRTLEITSIEDFGALLNAANFVTLLSTYLEGFSVILEPEGSVVTGIKEPLLQLCCLDASLAVKPVIERFNSVIITSGTLSLPLTYTLNS
jgi:DNA excision repair protein ERCC-2